MPGIRTLTLTLLLAATPAVTAYGDTTKVRIFAPSSARTSVAVTLPPSGEGPPLITVIVTPTKRYLRTERALFPTWTGFRKQYSGRRYPF